MSRWFRFYDEALDDLKVQRLSPHLFKAWINILCIASKHDGVLPSHDEIAFRMRVSDHDAKAYVDDLILAGLIDIGPDGKLSPHAWQDRQFQSDTSKDRTRKWREKKAKPSGDVTGDVTVTVGDEKCDGTDSDTNPDPDSNSENNSDAREPPLDGEEVLKGFVQEGLGRGGEVSAEARRKVSGRLAIADADPLVAYYQSNWTISDKAIDPDALFISEASNVWDKAPEAVRSACKPLNAPPPEPIPKPCARPSPSLLATLNKGKRYGVSAH